MKPPKVSALRGLALVVFAAYIALLLKVVLFKHPVGPILAQALSIEHLRARISYSTNLIPFRTVLFYLTSAHNPGLARFNLAGNLALLGPLGFLVPYIFPKLATLRHIAAAAFIVSLSLEVVQLLTGLGSFDVDDLLLNVIGAIAGWLVYRAAAKLLGRKNRTQMTA